MEITVVTLVEEQMPRGKCILPTQGMRPIISTVSISPKGFLPFILLLVVIIVTVVIVTVILVVVVVEDISPILKLLFVIIGFLYRIVLYPGDLVGLFYSNRLGKCIPPGQSVIDVDAADVDAADVDLLLGAIL
ncbi:hypothetical protein Tco_1438413 [Tanacetum coccineum]